MSTGLELGARIRRAAREEGLSIDRFAAALAPNPGSWIAQLEQASKPRPATIARFEALLAGKPVPAAPKVYFRKAPARTAEPTPHAARIQAAGSSETLAHIDRDPCFRCGTRADIGCKHQSPLL